MPRYYVDVAGREIELEVSQEAGQTIIRHVTDQEDPPVHVDFTAVHANVSTGEGLYSLIANGRSYQVHVERTDEGLRMVVGRHRLEAQVLTEREWRLKKVAPRAAEQTGKIVIKAPMPGLVKGVLVGDGEVVHEGQRLVVLEAMKMENEITAPKAGTITGVHVAQGSTVEGGKPLVTLE